MGNVSDKSCRENQNTHFVFNNCFFFNHAVYELTWQNNVQLGRAHMTIWRMRTAYCKPKAKNKHSEYETYCFSKAAMDARTRLNVTLYYIACLVYFHHMFR